MHRLRKLRLDAGRRRIRPAVLSGMRQTPVLSRRRSEREKAISHSNIETTSEG